MNLMTGVRAAIVGLARIGTAVSLPLRVGGNWPYLPACVSASPRAGGHI